MAAPLCEAPTRSRYETSALRYGVTREHWFRMWKEGSRGGGADATSSSRSGERTARLLCRADRSSGTGPFAGRHPGPRRLPAGNPSILSASLNDPECFRDATEVGPDSRWTRHSEARSPSSLRA